MYIGCVYMPTDSTSISVVDSCYERLNSLRAVILNTLECPYAELIIL